MSGYWSTIQPGTYQPMIPVTPFGPASVASFVSVMYVLLEIGVAPVLEDDVDLAGVEALPGDLLGERARLDLVAHLLEQALGDRDVGLGADPLVDHHLDGALAAVALAGRARPAALAPAGAALGAPLAVAAARAAAVVGAGVAPELLAQPATTIATIATPVNQRAHRVCCMPLAPPLCRRQPALCAGSAGSSRSARGGLRRPG